MARRGAEGYVQRMGKVIAVGLIVSSIVLAGRPARAHGRFPRSDEFIFSSSDHQLIVLRTTYGILLSRDSGGTWSFLCEETFLGGGTASFLGSLPIAVTANNALTVGAPLGLNGSTDLGCNWTCVGGPVAGQTVVDIAVRPNAPSSEVALMSSYAPSDSAESNLDSRVFESSDNGGTWAVVGVPLDPNFAPKSIQVSKSDPTRIYVAGTRNLGPNTTASLFIMKKGDPTGWTEWPLPPAQFDGTQEDAIAIGGVDPADANRVYLRSRSIPEGGAMRLTVVALESDHGAPTFATAKAFRYTIPDGASAPVVGDTVAFALSPDGSKIFTGTLADGLWQAQSAGAVSDLAFHKISPVGVQCLATRDNELWACSEAQYGFIAGRSIDGAKFTPKLRFVGDLTGPIACAPKTQGAACGQQTNASQCREPFDAFCVTNGCASPMLGDAALNEASTGMGTGPTKSPSCSCDMAREGRGNAAAFGAGLAFAAVAMRRRTRRGRAASARRLFC